MWYKPQASPVLDPAWPLMWAFTASLLPWCPCLTLCLARTSTSVLSPSSGSSMTKGQFCPLASSAVCVTALSSAKHLMRIYLQNVGSRLLRVCGGRRLGRGSQRRMPGAQESRKIKVGGKGKGRKEINLTAFYAQHLCPPLASQDSAHPRLGLLRSRRPGLPDADHTFPVAPDLYPPLTFPCARVRSGRNRAG